MQPIFYLKVGVIDTMCEMIHDLSSLGFSLASYAL